MKYKNDPHSFSRPESAVMHHLSLDLKVDFGRREISGSAKINFSTEKGAKELILDTKDLHIDRVLYGDNSLANFSLGTETEFLGQALQIKLRDHDSSVTVYYSSSPGAAALQWLEPRQTSGGKQPFLFTQSQAILARTWIPIQDSPGIKFTYDAKVQVPANLMALMSASNDTVLHSDGIYTFKMEQPVSSYLMALAVGDLKFKSLGRNSGVYAEPDMLEKSAWEFADMQKMIDSAEVLYGPYRWGRYDVLVLPPSFPFGGMENPRLTFATPTIIAGDRSLVSLVAHELAHSWSGNLVTNATWDELWLNEGFTVYFEQRIMEKIYGKEYAEMLAVLGKGELKNTLAELGETSPDTRLLLDLKGRDPDDGMSDIAYEKGRFFLRTIETAVGRPAWDAFVREYFDSHAFQSMSTEAFKEYLEANLIKGDQHLRDSIRIDEWIHKPGLPSNCPELASAELGKVEKELGLFVSGRKASELQTSGWTTHHWLHFLRNLPRKLSVEQLTELDNAFGFTGSGNSEILCDWFLHTIRNGYHKADNKLESFLMHVGRRKFLKPLYTELAKTEAGKTFAIKVFEKAQTGYHFVSANTIRDILGIKK